MRRPVYRHWLEAAKALAAFWARAQDWAVRDQPWWVRVDIWWPDQAHRDPANVLDALMDALQGPIVTDDWWLRPAIQTVNRDRAWPRVECRFYPEPPAWPPAKPYTEGGITHG